ncbi:MAG: PadR family transcriptional regulator [Candidatus Hodarchaeota archaeon]
MAFGGRGRIKTSEGSISLVQLIILTLLNQQPTHGYGVMQGLEGRLGRWRLKSGTVYPALHSLRDRKFISEEKVQQEDRPDAIEYKLTPKGKKILREGLHSLGDEFQVQDHFWRFLGTSLKGEAQDALLEWSTREPTPFGFVALRRHCQPGHCGPRHLEYLKRYREYLERELKWVAQRLEDLKSSNEPE